MVFEFSNVECGDVVLCMLFQELLRFVAALSVSLQILSQFVGFRHKQFELVHTEGIYEYDYVVLAESRIFQNVSFR